MQQIEPDHKNVLGRVYTPNLMTIHSSTLTPPPPPRTYNDRVCDHSAICLRSHKIKFLTTPLSSTVKFVRIKI